MKRRLLYLITLIWIFVSCLFVWWISYVQADLAPEDVGVNKLKEGCLTGMGKWCFSYDAMIRWKDSQTTAINKNRTVMTIAQDVILTATYMVWTVLTVILLYCWLMYIFAARWGKEPSKYKDWLVKAAIWAVLVRWAYAIVRLIQYIAQW
jgi:hypothetical protein